MPIHDAAAGPQPVSVKALVAYGLPSAATSPLTFMTDTMGSVSSCRMPTTDIT